MLPSRQDVLKMRLEPLREVVQLFLGLDDWPGDWIVAGQILEQSYFNFQRAMSGAELFGITLFGEQVNGTGIDENALVAIFRAYVLRRLEEEELRGRL
jgi:hypothetical protein